jgi:hypothetical protein
VRLHPSDMDVFERKPLAADHRIHYGPLESQFGDLRLPQVASGRSVFLHGGCWRCEGESFNGLVLQASESGGLNDGF